MNEEGDVVARDTDDTGETEETLIQAVSNLTRVVSNLDELLRRDYPRRAEIERRFLSKQASRRLIAQMVIVSLIVVVGINILTLTAYSKCFGRTSGIPGPCFILPGADDRQDRSRQLNETDRINELRILRLERELGLKPMPREELSEEPPE